MRKDTVAAAAGYTPYSQRDLRWRWKKVGLSARPFHEFGCLLTCLAMMVGRRPDELNDQLIAAGAFKGANLLSARAAEVLGLDYAGKVDEIEQVPTVFPTIREVDYTRDGGEFERHFVLQLRDVDGSFYLVDPYGAVRRPLDYYRFISYRLFSKRPVAQARGEASSGRL